MKFSKQPSIQLLVLAGFVAFFTFITPPWKSLDGNYEDILCNTKGTSLGIFHGEHGQALQPIDLLGVQGPAAWPVVNPVFTAGGLKSYDGIAGPRLWLYQGRLLMFYEATSCDAGRRAIGIAESVDDGVTWRGLGNVLTSQSQDALRRPNLFTYNGQIFMVTDSAAGVKLYRCTRFPMGWHYNVTMTQDPIRGVSIFKPVESRRWYMIGSLPKTRDSTPAGGDPSQEDDVLAVYTSFSPLGPWNRVETSPFAVSAASHGGPVLDLDKYGIVRLGRSCKQGKCGDVVARSFKLVDGNVLETELSNFLAERIWKQDDSWDGLERSAASMMALPSGKVAAVVVGRPKDHPLPWYVVWLYLGVIVFQAIALSCFVAVFAIAALRIRRRRLALRPLPVAMAPPPRTSPGAYSSTSITPTITPKHHAVQRLQAEERGESMSPRSATSSTLSRRSGLSGLGSTAADLASRFVPFGGMLGTPDEEKGTPISSASSLSQSTPGSTGGGKRRAVLDDPLKRLGGRLVDASPRQVAALTTLLVLCGSFAYVFGRISTVFAPFWEPAQPVPVGGQLSRFTLVVMSYEARRSLLESYIKHYSQCPSVGEILIVWNKGTPPDPTRDFSWAPVPVRVRVEDTNSLNNRYKPDSKMRYRGVLSLDDDLRIPCTEIERAFGVWRANPGSITGYFPRLAEVSTATRYHAEPEAIEKGWYNMVLTGAAFLDSRASFSNYWSDALAEARAVVDQVHNCDDLLMNFAVANATTSKKKSTVAYIRASRRIDVSRWSGVGLSHSVNHFLEDAELCLKEFETIFGRWPLHSEPFQWGDGINQMGTKPKCPNKRSGALDCSYLSN